MGLFGKMFGSKVNHVPPYIEAGSQLLRTIPDAIGLNEWQGGLPSYTSTETCAIAFATREGIMGDTSAIDPEIVDCFLRSFVANALVELAGEGWKYSSKTHLPDDWTRRVSTYLKAWLADMNPKALLDMAEMLAKAGYREEAIRAYRAVLLFPSYAPKFFGSSPELTASMVERAQTALKEASTTI